MIVVKPSVEIINPQSYETVLNTVERAIRNCYRSEDSIKDGSAEKIIKGCIARGHESPLEFCDIAVRIVADRAFLAQVTRHRLASYCVESQRYVNYSKEKFGEEIKIIEPKGLNNDSYELWRASMITSESAYMVMTRDYGVPAEVARSVLPNSTATTIFMKANAREWRNIFKLRCDKHAQQDMREIMYQLLEKFYNMYPAFFEDIIKDDKRGI